MRSTILLACVLWSSLSFATARPKLAVVVVIDQLSDSHLQQRIEQGEAPNIARLMANGFRFRDARYDAAPALTGAGHSTLSTGAWPELNGVPANSWYDAKLGREVNCVEDPAYRVLGREPKPFDGTAPTTVRAGSLGESLKMRYAEAKVVGVAAKDRSAILLSGPGADLALWLDPVTPRFTTSNYYAKSLPAWLDPINQRLQQAITASFTPSLPRGGITGRNPERKPNPFRVPDAEGLTDAAIHNPALDSWVVDVALAATRELKLGVDAAPDLLTISFSTFDKVMHAWGPESEQAAIAIQQIDQDVRKLIEGLDAQVGKGNYVFVLTSDHGGLLLPERLRARGIDSGQVNGKQVCEELEKVADKQLGNADWFIGFKSTGCYANPKLLAKLHTIDAMLSAAAEKTKGLRRLYAKPELMKSSADPVAQLYQRGLDAERSPDFIIATQPYWLFGPGDATGHGTWHLYDRHVPLAFYGAGVKRGTGERAESIDVAPTLARVLGCEPPADAQGQVLTAALQ